MPFQIVRNDITRMQVDAIVNTANPAPGYGPGTDRAVYEAAGRDKLLAKRREIGAIDPGTAVITDGYDLPAAFIIHTVGTAWKGGGAGEEEILRKCYRSVFRVAADNNITSLAIPLLASGSYGFPKDVALRIALSEIGAFLSETDMDVCLVVYDEESVSLSSDLYGDIDEYIDDNYVEDKRPEEYPDLYGSGGRPLWGSGNAAGGPASAFRVFESERNEGSGFVVEEAVSSDEDYEYDEAQPYFALNLPDREPARERSLEDVINNLEKTFMELVFSFADAKGLTDVEVQKRANLDRKAFSKLKCGTTKNPSKSTALALAVALELDLDETKDLLSRAGLALSPCSKQDVIVQYFIEKAAYDIYEINVALFEHGEQLLGSHNA